MTSEALALDTWPVLLVAAGLSLLDAIPGRSPFAVVSGLFVSVAYPLRPDRPAVGAALVRGGALALAAALIGLGVSVAGTVLAALVALEAAVDAVAGRCGLCWLLTRRLGPPVSAFGLVGSGPWLVALDSGACPICRRIVDVLSERSSIRVQRIDVDEAPRLGGFARVVPAALVVDREGRVQERLLGPRSPDRIDRFLERSGLLEVGDPGDARRA